MKKLLLMLFIIFLSKQNLANSNITVLAASDVSQSSIDTTIKWLNVAEKAWFLNDTEASKLFYPILLVIVGKDIDAAIELEGRLCSEIEKNIKDNSLN